MNEIEKKCPHCGCEFTIDNPKAITQKFCSAICRTAAYNKKPKGVQMGPCKTCGKMFMSSRADKIFCDMKCYTSNKEFQNRIKSQATMALKKSMEKRGFIYTGKTKYICLHCNIEFYAKPSEKRRFCTFSHYRSYMAERFDRWIASPEGMALPQNYDEFMLQEDLPCLIEGCNWRGKHLGAHVNFAHGITAEDFKRAAGFNLSTGLVTEDLSKSLSERPHINLGSLAQYRGFSSYGKGKKRNYISREGEEHRKKSMALVGAFPCEKERVCKMCGKEFIQTFTFGAKKYCSVECRNEFYKKNEEMINVTCYGCGNEFLAGKQRINRANKRNGPNKIYCSKKCSAEYNWAIMPDDIKEKRMVVIRSNLRNQ